MAAIRTNPAIQQLNDAVAGPVLAPDDPGFAKKPASKHGSSQPESSSARRPLRTYKPPCVGPVRTTCRLASSDRTRSDGTARRRSSRDYAGMQDSRSTRTRVSPPWVPACGAARDRQAALFGLAPLNGSSSAPVLSATPSAAVWPCSGARTGAPVGFVRSRSSPPMAKLLRVSAAAEPDLFGTFVVADERGNRDIDDC